MIENTPDLEQLFSEALLRPAGAERMAFVASACGADVDKRQRLEQLLRVFCDAASFLESPPCGATAVFEHPTLETAGSTIGRYKLMEQIGEGGMGLVFVAEQTEPVRRRVALKLIKPGMDSREVIARFESERQALAMMDHPNIARVFDAGTTNAGRPYFVMELVRGLPITEYCDKLKLSTAKRLELFTTVCQAVQHAHLKGIIHRDLKPSNILVTVNDDQPVVKVIDFGIAKAMHASLSQHTVYTAFSQLVGTPNYMSPEQAGLNSLDIDTRSDVYSLGVLLYELLTGQLPFDRETLRKAGMLEMRRIIQEEEPLLPSKRISTLAGESRSTISEKRGLSERLYVKSIRGELDWLVMKALEKDRSRRYESASAFAADIQRYLQDQPVEAGPPSMNYRARKFLKRNRAAVAVTCSLFAVLMFGTIATGIGLWRATRAEAVAKTRFEEAQVALQRAEKAEAETLEDFRASTDDAIEQLIGSKDQLGPQEKSYLKNTIQRWQQFAARQANDERGQAIGAEGHFRLGEIWKKLGEHSPAKIEFEEAIKQWGLLVNQSSNKPDYRNELSRSHVGLGNLFEGQQLLVEASKEYQIAKDISLQLTKDFPDSADYQYQLSAAMVALGSALSTAEKVEASQLEFQSAKQVRISLVNRFPEEPKYLRGLAGIHSGLAESFQKLGKLEDAKNERVESNAIRKNLVDRFPEDPKFREDVAVGHSALGLLMCEQGKFSDAERELRDAIEMHQKLVNQFPSLPIYRQQLATAMERQSRLLSDIRKFADSIANYKLTLALFEDLAKQQPQSPGHKQRVAATHSNLGSVYFQSGEIEKSRDALRLAISCCEDLLKEDPSLPLNKYSLIEAHAKLGTVCTFMTSAAYPEAEAELRKAVNLGTNLVEQFPKRIEYTSSLANAYNSLGYLFTRAGEVSKAQTELEKAVELFETLVAQSPTSLEYKLRLILACYNLGNLFQRSNDPEKSQKWFDKELAFLQPTYREYPLNEKVKRILIQCYVGQAKNLDSLRQSSESENVWRSALELSDEAGVENIRTARASYRMRAGLMREALNEADELLNGTLHDPISIYNLACAYSIAASKLPEEQTTYSDRAMELLTKTLAAGFNKPDQLDHISKDADLAPLRERDDYKKLIQQFSVPSAPAEHK